MMAASSSTRYVDFSQDGAGSAVELVLDATGVGVWSSPAANPWAKPSSWPSLPARWCAAAWRARCAASTSPSRTQADGRFEVRGLVHGTYNLRALAPGIPLHQRVS
ncbi:carboxypeptidase regulatory-like domain-containing protein [Myxococcus xanthus]|uniref:carboxypeptidase regulatory-like domain-containing protein n=1 Tax=Myxococcus xanthus TaxID=34 RepID=UPI001129A64F|nr:carboxypeptidase regulatory-like domain-containing protein [Myxococcus xanthus]QDE82707.1 hypothetical protein BHS07_14700 [Myxococcus xanthus]